MQAIVVEPGDVLDDGSSWERERQMRSAISSVLKESTKLSAHRVVIGVADSSDRGEDTVVLYVVG